MDAENPRELVTELVASAPGLSSDFRHLIETDLDQVGNSVLALDSFIQGILQSGDRLSAPLMARLTAAVESVSTPVGDNPDTQLLADSFEQLRRIA